MFFPREWQVWLRTDDRSSLKFSYYGRTESDKKDEQEGYFRRKQKRELELLWLLISSWRRRGGAMVSLVFCVSLVCEASIRNLGVFCSFYGFDPSKEKFWQHLPSKVLMLTDTGGLVFTAQNWHARGTKSLICVLLKDVGRLIWKQM